MSDEYSKIVELPVSKLSRTDLQELGKLLTDGMNSRDDSRFSISVGDGRYAATSLDELLSKNIPQTFHALSIEVKNWTSSHSIDRGISLDLRPYSSQFQIYSDDEVWFKGKTEQLKEFFRCRTPWYGKIRNQLPSIFGAIYGLSLTLLPFLLWKRFYWTAAFYILTLISVRIIERAYSQKKLFPYTEIRLIEVDKTWLNEYTAMLALTAIGTLAAVVSAVIELEK